MAHVHACNCPATHGLDYPESYSLPLELEDIVRRGNAVPATIALLNGKIHIGLLPEELLRLVSSKTNKPLKVSRRDIAAALVQGKNGGTTVAATMFLAHQAGIKVFCTGGIGGVHRGGERTLDISADLTELGTLAVFWLIFPFDSWTRSNSCCCGLRWRKKYPRHWTYTRISRERCISGSV